MTTPQAQTSARSAKDAPRSVALRHRFGVQLSLLLLLAALVPAAVVSAVSSSIAQDSLAREVRGRLLSVVEHDAERLESWASRRRSEVRALARSNDVIEALRNGSADAGSALSGRLRLHSEALEFTNLVVIQADATVLAATEGSSLTRQRLTNGSELSRVFDRARLVGESEFSDFSTQRLTGAQSDSPRALVGAPVFDAGRVIGVVVAELDDREVQRSARSLSALGASGAIDIVGYVGGRAAYVNGSREAPRRAFRQAISLETDTLQSIALRGGRGDGAHEDRPGHRTYAVWRYIPSLRWGIVTQVDEAEAFAPARRLRALSIALSAVAAALAALIAAWGARRVSGPVAALTAQAARVADGDLSTRVRVQGHGELARLAQVFNGMVNELQEHTEGLERLVSARTKELTEKGARIRESIELARQIESSMLPDPQSAPAAIRKTALIWRPLDQVGGDLAFVEPTADGGFVAGVIDCTGHGVAAAMTAMFAASLCSLAIATHGNKGPAEVLRELDRKLERAFKRARGEGISLGMDVALVVAMPDEPVRFAGAGVGLLYRKFGGSFAMLSGRRVGLGYGGRRKDIAIEEHALDAATLDTLVLYSDGILDEPQGTRGEGLGRARLVSMLDHRATLEITEALAQIDREVIAGRAERPQRDDVTVLGLSLMRGALGRATEGGA